MFDTFLLEFKSILARVGAKQGCLNTDVTVGVSVISQRLPRCIRRKEHP